MPNLSTSADSDQSIDYNFNYEDQDFKPVVSSSSNEAGKSPEAVIVTAFLGGTFANLILIILCILFTKCRGYVNVRLFTTNLVITQFIQMMYILCLEDAVFGFKKTLSYQMRSLLEKYILQLQEWTQIVYCGTTSLLIFDFIFRRRNNGVGVKTIKWTIILLASDILPLIYIYFKTQFFQYTELMPKPLAIYHMLCLLMLTGSTVLLFVIAACVPCCCVDNLMLGQPRDSMSSRQPFSPFTFTRIFLFVLLTVAFQYTGVYMVSMDIASKMVNTDKAMSTMIKFKGVIEVGMNVHKWSTILRPYFESLAILLFLPSFGDRIFGYARCSSESKHTAGSVPSSPE